MRVMLFGATGMVGQGVLRECVRDPRVTAVLAVGRSATGRRHPKLRERVTPDVFDLAAVRDELVGYDACFFCLGVSSAGMTEAAYTRVTFDLTVAVARAVAGVHPGMVFVYVSGRGTDSSERGRVMWARVKGRTENALLALPLRVYLFRPGYIQPMHGTRSKTASYRALYAVAAPAFPVLRRLFPRHVTTTERVGRAMIEVADAGAPHPVLETADINAVAARTA